MDFQLLIPDIKTELIKEEPLDICIKEEQLEKENEDFQLGASVVTKDEPDSQEENNSELSHFENFHFDLADQFMVKSERFEENKSENRIQTVGTNYNKKCEEKILIKKNVKDLNKYVLLELKNLRVVLKKLDKEIVEDFEKGISIVIRNNNLYDIKRKLKKPVHSDKLLIKGKNKRLKSQKCFSVKQDNDTSIQLTHDQEYSSIDTLKCPDCSFTTNFKYALINHKLTHLCENDIMQCPKCSFKTIKKKLFMTHVRLHFYKYLHTCRKCDFSSNNKTILNDHLNTHKTIIPLKTYYRFYKKKNLGVKLVPKNCKVFSCPKCNYSCSNEYSKNQHALSHQECKGIKCEHCDYETKYKGNMTKHVKIHIKENYYY